MERPTGILSGLCLLLCVSAASSQTMDAFSGMVQARELALGGPNKFGGAAHIGGGAAGGGCGLHSHPYKKDMFMQLVNKKQVARHCAPGTQFEAASCTCANKPRAPTPVGKPGAANNAWSPPGASTNFLNNVPAAPAGGNPLYQAILQKLQMDASKVNRKPAQNQRNQNRRNQNQRNKPQGSQPWSPSKPSKPKPRSRFEPASPGSLKPIPQPMKPRSRAKINRMDQLRKTFASEFPRNNKNNGGKPTGPGGPSAAELLKMMQSTGVSGRGKASTPRQRSSGPNSRQGNYPMAGTFGANSNNKKPNQAGPTGAGVNAALVSDIVSLLSNNNAGRGNGLAALNLPSVPGPTRGAGGGRGAVLPAHTAGIGALHSNAAAAALLGGGNEMLAAIAGHSVQTPIAGLSSSQLALLIGETPGTRTLQNMDTAEILNLQGQLSSQGLSGIEHVSPHRLAVMDRLDHVDAGDLTPLGLAALGRRMQG